MSDKKFYVQIIEYASGEVEKELGPYNTERMADKACDGVDVNLNHGAYYSQVVEK